MSPKGRLLLPRPLAGEGPRPARVGWVERSDTQQPGDSGGAGAHGQTIAANRADHQRQKTHSFPGKFPDGVRGSLCWWVLGFASSTQPTRADATKSGHTKTASLQHLMTAGSNQSDTRSGSGGVQVNTSQEAIQAALSGAGGNPIEALKNMNTNPRGIGQQLAQPGSSTMQGMVDAGGKPPPSTSSVIAIGKENMAQLGNEAAQLVFHADEANRSQAERMMPHMTPQGGPDGSRVQADFAQIQGANISGYSGLSADVDWNNGAKTAAAVLYGKYNQGKMPLFKTLVGANRMDGLGMESMIKQIGANPSESAFANTIMQIGKSHSITPAQIEYLQSKFENLSK